MTSRPSWTHVVWWECLDVRSRIRLASASNGGLCRASACLREGLLGMHATACASTLELLYSSIRQMLKANIFSHLRLQLPLCKLALAGVNDV